MRDLQKDVIDVWHLELTEPHAERHLLIESEAERADRIRIEEKRVQFTAGRALLRHILGSYVDANPSELRFAYGEHGKPALADHPHLVFNLSHSHDVGLLAVMHDSAAGAGVGVDVERQRSGRRFADLARRFFSPAESDALLARPVADRPAAFYRAWTRKEAYLKAWGTGLSFPSNQFTITFGPGPTELLHTAMPGDKTAWHFHTIPVPRDFAGALCYPGPRRWLRHTVKTSHRPTS